MKTKRIFIDTNIYLDFYRCSKQSLKSLTAIIQLIRENKVKIILPAQVVNEFKRDKERIFVDFVNANFIHLNNPGFIDKERIKRINSLLAKIRSEYEKKFFNPRSNINVALKELFDLSIIPEETAELLDLAHYRTLRRNPPRKDNNSFGDAIIWETLLNSFSDGDLIVISRDGDFASERNKKEIHPFLKDEWYQKKKKTVCLMDSLGEVINAITEKEIVKQKAIEEEKEFGAIPAESILMCFNDSKTFSVSAVPNSNLNNSVLSVSGNEIPMGFSRLCRNCGTLSRGHGCVCLNCGLLLY